MERGIPVEEWLKIAPLARIGLIAIGILPAIPKARRRARARRATR